MEHLKVLLLWLAQPDNLMNVLGALSVLFTLLGWQRAAARAKTATAVLGVVVSGVNKGKKTGAVAVEALEMIQAEAEKAGVQPVLEKIVDATKDVTAAGLPQVALPALDAAREVLTPKPLTARFLPRSAKAFLGVGALLVVVLLAGCGAPPEAVEQADESLAINVRLAEAKDLSRDARRVALSNADAWAAQRYVLTERATPEALAAAIAAVRSELGASR